jgi:hypothetical protein
MGWYELTLFSNYDANKIWPTKMLNCLNLSHRPYGLACYVVSSCWVCHVLTLVYFLVSTTLGLLLRLGELWRFPRRFSGVLGVLSSVSCLWRHFIRCENSLFMFRLRLWSCNNSLFVWHWFWYSQCRCVCVTWSWRTRDLCIRFCLWNWVWHWVWWFALFAWA